MAGSRRRMGLLHHPPSKVWETGRTRQAGTGRHSRQAQQTATGVCGPPCANELAGKSMMYSPTRNTSLCVLTHTPSVLQSKCSPDAYIARAMLPLPLLFRSTRCTSSAPTFPEPLLPRPARPAANAPLHEHDPAQGWARMLTATVSCIGAHVHAQHAPRSDKMRVPSMHRTQIKV